MLTVEEAQARVLDLITPLPVEAVQLTDALGRVLAEPAVATRDQPPADNSAMDGYALRRDDLGALDDGGGPVELTVAETIQAGGWSERPLLPGEAARIFTGAPLPPGADTVVMQEWTEALDGGARVRVERCGERGHHIRRAGEDVTAGQVYVPAGRPLRPSDLALLASQGLPEVRCHRRPIVAIVSTGDEVHEPGEPLPPGHIWAGNTYGLKGLIREAGGAPRNLGIARDDLASLREVFGHVEGSDVVVSIGGVSVGDFDLVRDVLAEMGEQEFWKVAMRPGKPNACGRLAGIPYFGLPGNPVSCMVSFLQYVRPALLKLQGCSELFLPTLDAVLDHDLTSPERFLVLNRGVLRFDADSGRARVRTTGPQGSGMMASLAAANCLISVPEGITHVAEGELVRVQLLPGVVPAQAASGLRRAGGSATA